MRLVAQSNIHWEVDPSARPPGRMHITFPTRVACNSHLHPGLLKRSTRGGPEFLFFLFPFLILLLVVFGKLYAHTDELVVP
jgi:hypothetical protein